MLLKLMTHNGKKLADVLGRHFRLTKICRLSRMLARIESSPLTKLNGGLSWLHSADEDAVSWLTNYGS